MDASSSPGSIIPPFYLIKTDNKALEGVSPVRQNNQIFSLRNHTSNLSGYEITAYGNNRISSRVRNAAKKRETTARRI
ncbi:MAG: hypothetical protein A3J24_02840 [Deltaproteobacteria bacterium RIFCSPLOWO2_02_FULL_53_8]|nr:MAG: hypothetical protein A3J24_02840 [Deltaproteobacteria bacterium RIFCSPLOWO2_02_FULL_53_8]